MGQDRVVILLLRNRAADSTFVMKPLVQAFPELQGTAEWTTLVRFSARKEADGLRQMPLLSVSQAVSKAAGTVLLVRLARITKLICETAAIESLDLFDILCHLPNRISTDEEARAVCFNPGVEIQMPVSLAQAHAEQHDRAITMAERVRDFMAAAGPQALQVVQDQKKDCLAASGKAVPSPTKKIKGNLSQWDELSTKSIAGLRRTESKLVAALQQTRARMTEVSRRLQKLIDNAAQLKVPAALISQLRREEEVEDFGVPCLCMEHVKTLIDSLPQEPGFSIVLTALRAGTKSVPREQYHEKALACLFNDDVLGCIYFPSIADFQNPYTRKGRLQLPESVIKIYASFAETAMRKQNVTRKQRAVFWYSSFQALEKAYRRQHFLKKLMGTVQDEEEK